MNSDHMTEDASLYHMTKDASLFHTYNPCHENFSVRIADGSLSRVARIGSVAISKYITLDSVLLVPKLECNLLSISKLTKDLNCVTKFLKNVSVSGFRFGEDDW